ncbi:hypothetical protein OXX59_000981 [Metschnikowia pulcherrima]
MKLPVMLLRLNLLALIAFMLILISASVTRDSIQSSLINHESNFSKDSVTHDVTHAETLVSRNAISLSHQTIDHENAGWQTAEGMLDKFLTRLKTFIKKRKFDYIQFEAESEKLKNRLSDIDNLIYSATPAEKRTARFRELSFRVKFAWHVLGEMSSTVSELVYYGESNATGHRLVLRIIESNIALYALLNVRGHIDLQVKHLARKVFLAWREVIVWDSQLENTNGVLSELRQVFTKHKESAEKKIRALVVQLPDDFGC